MKRYMKKIYFALVLAGGLLSSCDMDKKPYGSLDDQTAVQTLNDCFRFRNGLYSSMRGITAGAWINTQEIQMDLYQGVNGNGNQVGNFANGTFLSSEQDIEGFWSSIYAIINKANYVIEKMEAIEAGGTFSEADLKTMKRYDGESRFVRAYCYFWLVDHFCQAYSTSNAQTPAMGVPIVTKYYPTADRSIYPGRSTLDEAYKLISDDLEIAYSALKDYESQSAENVPVPNSAYLTSYTVNALQARIALAKGEYSVALSKAESVITSNIYELTGIDKYINLWIKDEGTEVLFRPFMASTELGSSTGGSYFLSANEESAWYVPTQSMLLMYGEGDVRFDAFFKVYKNLKSGGESVAVYVFNKFPGNESLKTGAQPNFMNMMKPFRLSELYLIAAEAAANTNDATKANKYLNDLRARRIAKYQAETLSGNALMQAIKTERLKELIGEGFRLSDLRRWGEGFVRDASYSEINPAVEDIFVAAGRNVTYQAGDYRFVWPIPASEIQANPQLDGQQNPGY